MVQGPIRLDGGPDHEIWLSKSTSKFGGNWAAQRNVFREKVVLACRCNVGYRRLSDWTRLQWTLLSQHTQRTSTCSRLTLNSLVIIVIVAAAVVVVYVTIVRLSFTRLKIENRSAFGEVTRKIQWCITAYYPSHSIQPVIRFFATSYRPIGVRDTVTDAASQVHPTCIDRHQRPDTSCFYLHANLRNSHACV